MAELGDLMTSPDISPGKLDARTGVSKGKKSKGRKKNNKSKNKRWTRDSDPIHLALSGYCTLTKGR